jgi:hypothetical protein
MPLRVDRRLLGRGPVPGRLWRPPVEVADDRPAEREGVLVVEGEVVATPETFVWRSPPPRSSALTSSPVAAFTSGGPPRKIVPIPRTITVSSLIAGT